MSRYSNNARQCGVKREAHSQVKSVKTAGLGQLLAVEMSKIARWCGAEHIRKSKVVKTDGLGPLLAIEMPKAHTAVTQVKSVKNRRSQTIFRR